MSNTSRIDATLPNVVHGSGILLVWIRIAWMMVMGKRKKREVNMAVRFTSILMFCSCASPVNGGRWHVVSDVDRK